MRQARMNERRPKATACFRHVSEASDALNHAQEVSDFQAVGVRCREALLAFTGAAQIVVPWSSDTSAKPKKAWVDHICSVTLAGQTNEHRRHLLKALLDEAWHFSNWLTHAKASAWHDAEAATTTVEHALGLATSLVLRHVRGVNLTPARACLVRPAAHRDAAAGLPGRRQRHRGRAGAGTTGAAGDCVADCERAAQPPARLSFRSDLQRIRSR